MVLIDIYQEDGSPHPDSPVERDVAHSKLARERGYWHRNSYIIPINGRGEVLMQFRSNKASHPSRWAVPAEHPYVRESSLNAAIRGLDEELKIKSHPDELEEVIYRMKFHLTESPDFVDQELQTYFGFWWNGDPAEIDFNRAEVKGVGLVPAREINKAPYTTPLDEEHLNLVLKGLIKKGYLDKRSLRDPTKHRWFRAG